MADDGLGREKAPRAAVAFAGRDFPYFSFRLRQFYFPGGIAEAFARAPRGAFGVVLLGSCEGTEMAVKVLIASRREDHAAEVEILSFLREQIKVALGSEDRGVRRRLEDLGARHVVYVFGMGEEPDLANVAPGLQPGPARLLAVEPLDRTLTEAFLQHRVPPLPPPPISTLLRVAHEVALALAFLAHRNVVHSDIKPDNVMLATDGRTVICDLGLARVIGSPRAGGYDGHGGTLAYLAPELHVKEARSPSLATDVYAFSLLLWCLFSGRQHAWQGADGRLPDEDTISLLVMRGDRPDLEALRADTPAGVRDLIQRCWAQEPSE